MPDYAINRTLYAVCVREHLNDMDRPAYEVPVADLVSDAYEDYCMQDEWK